MRHPVKHVSRENRGVMAIKKKLSEETGVIRDNEAYTLAAFKRRLDLTDSAWWALVKTGMPHKIIGKRKIILGKDALKFFAEMENATIAD